MIEFGSVIAHTAEGKAGNNHFDVFVCVYFARYDAL